MLIAFFQIIATSVVWAVLKIFTRFEIHGTENLKEVSRPFVVVANHESVLDPPLIGVMLLHRPQLFPIRFMTKDLLIYIPIFGQIIWLLGAFRARKKKGIGRSLLAPVKILEGRNGVMMFPEAHIIHERAHLGEGRRGAAILALTTKAQLLPVSLHTPANLNLFTFIFTRPKIVVRVGTPYYLNNLDYPDFSDENTFAATKVIMQKIADLYFQHKY